MSERVVVTQEDLVTVVQEDSVTVVQVVSPGPAGPQGEPGPGLPGGGTTGQVLTKISNADEDTGWADPAVSSVNGQTGVVGLDQDDVPDGVTAKQYTATEKAKLAGIAAGATQNASDAALRDRTTHTGTQAISTVAGLQTALDGKQDDDPTLVALAMLDSTPGVLVETGADTFTKRTITGTAGEVAVSNGDGVGGNPTIGLASTSVVPGSYTNTNLTVDAKGRITAAFNGSGGNSGISEELALAYAVAL